MTMTHKERFITALRFEEPDYVPIDGTFIDLIHVERITGKHAYGAGSGGGGGGVSTKQEEMTQEEMMFHNQTLENEARMKLDLDALTISDYKVFPEGYEPKFIDKDTYVDLWGKIYKIKEDVKTTWWVDGIIRTPEDLEKWRSEFPDPKEFNYDIVDLTIEVAEKNDYPIMVWVHGSMMFPYLMMGGIDKLVLAIYRQPEFAKMLIKTVADLNFEITKQILNRGRGHIDLVAESDDIADVKTPFYALKIFREFFLPYFQRLIGECHSRGIPFMKHSDGNLYPYLDDFVALGVNGLHPIEPGVMDLADVKQGYGDKFVLRGNVDCTHVLPYGTKEDVRKEVRRCIDDAAEGGGFILADSNSLHSLVKTENIKVMIDEGRKYGRYPLQKS
jgi:uroporphyrinogen-III decarboxylase